MNNDSKSEENTNEAKPENNESDTDKTSSKIENN